MNLSTEQKEFFQESTLIYLDKPGFFRILDACKINNSWQIANYCFSVLFNSI